MDHPPLPVSIQNFLDDLRYANRSTHTIRAYASDLRSLAALHPGPIDEITMETLRNWAEAQAYLCPATRARRQAAAASLLRWAIRCGHLQVNPMDRMDRVRKNPPRPRGLPREHVERILTTIPTRRRRDRLLFRLLFETGLRIGEALALHVEDVELRPDDEHLDVVGKRGRRRTVLLDDPQLVRQLRDYLKRTGYRHGPLFRAEVNGRGGPLRHQSVHAIWMRCCEKSGVHCTLHQLRHSHATELVREGVSLATIRKRLGHRSLQTTLLYAEQSDAAADAEIRAWRRRRASLI